MKSGLFSIRGEPLDRGKSTPLKSNLIIHVELFHSNRQWIIWPIIPRHWPDHMPIRQWSPESFSTHQ
jgi:hypothetical protein